MSSNNTIRINTTPGEDKNIQIKLDQDFDLLEVLSLKLTQEQTYNNFCSNYGVVIGRVIANDGFGIENAKVSVFIPLQPSDRDNPLVTSLYPYRTVTDVNSQNIRYNLLPNKNRITKYFQAEPCGIVPFTPNNDICGQTRPSTLNYRACKVFNPPNSITQDHREIGDESNWFLSLRNSNCNGDLEKTPFDYCDNLTQLEKNVILNESKRRRKSGESQDYFELDFTSFTFNSPNGSVWGKYFTIDSVNNSYYIWYNDGAGIQAQDPNIPNKIGIEVRVPQNATSSTMRDYTRVAFRSVITGSEIGSNSNNNIDNGLKGCGVSSVIPLHNTNCNGPICDIEVFNISNNKLFLRNVDFGSSQAPPTLGTLSGNNITIIYQPPISNSSQNQPGPINTTGNTLLNLEGFYDEAFTNLNTSGKFPINQLGCQGFECPPDISAIKEGNKIDWNEYKDNYGFIPPQNKSVFYRVDWVYYSGGSRILDTSLLDTVLSGETFYTSNNSYSALGTFSGVRRRCFKYESSIQSQNYDERYETFLPDENSPGPVTTFIKKPALCKYPIRIYKTNECDFGPTPPPTKSCLSIGTPISDWQMVEDNCSIDGTTLWSIDVDSGFGPKNQVGTFPSKQDILENDTVLEIYDKYYKYTTKTNESGDYMIFGVPTGIQTIHMDTDLSDIGTASLFPQDLINLGFPENLFKSPSEFKVSTNLNTLAQIQSQNKSVDVIPFWGNLEQCELGITRVDFNIIQEISPSATIIATTFTNSIDAGVNVQCGQVNGADDQNFCAIGNMKSTPVMVNATDRLGNTKTEQFSDGIIVMSLPMYEGRKVTNEFGQIVDSTDPEKGIPTSGYYEFKLSLPDTQAPPNPPNGYYTAEYRGSKAILRYDLTNRERLIYTFGNQNFAKVASVSNDQTWFILGQKDTNTTNDVCYPSVGSDSNTPTDNKSYFGEGEVCYGSVFFPKFHVNNNGKFCDKLVSELGSGFVYNNGTGMDCRRVMEITKVVPIFRKPPHGGGPTTALHWIPDWHVIPQTPTFSVKLENGFTGYGGYTDLLHKVNLINNNAPEELSNQTIPLYDSIEQGDGILDKDNKVIPNTSTNINTVKRVAPKYFTYSGTLPNISVSPDYDIDTNENDRLSGRTTNMGRYFMFFGLNKNNNALTKLKSKLGL